MKRRKTFKQQIAVYIGFCIEKRDNRRRDLAVTRLLTLTWLLSLWWSVRELPWGRVAGMVEPVGVAITLLYIVLVSLVWLLKPVRFSSPGLLGAGQESESI